MRAEAVSVLTFVLCCSVTSVKINKLQVPEVIQHGNPAVLDCDFTLEENDLGLVVKWFFNKTLVYQWIPGTEKPPQGLSVLKDRLNLDYVASHNASSKHRALHILRTGPDLSGNYTCKVSTDHSEDVRTKAMLVLVAEKHLLLRRLKAEEGLMKVQCLADGVFPKPIMSLHSQEREITGAEVTASQRGHLYEVSAIVTLPASKDPQEISCKLHIPEANYTTNRETVFYPGESGGGRSLMHQTWLSVSTSLFSTAAIAIAVLGRPH